MIPIGQEKLLFKAELEGVIINVAANALLIPRYDVAGAAVATLVSEIVVTAAAAMYILRFVRLRILDFGVYMKSVIACGAGLLFAFIVSFSGPAIIHVTIAAVIFFFTFLAVMYLLGDEFVRTLLKSGVNR